ncbi:MAG: hypothetical protein V4484_19275 [Pseudomonadota bacterium]
MLERNGPEMLYDHEGYNDMSAAWRQNQPRENFMDFIAQVLPPTESWSDKIRIWGDQTKSDIQVSYDGTAVESVMVRIDTRDDTFRLCSQIVDLARALDCFFLLPSGRSIISAGVTALSNAVHGSKAAHFSAGPRDLIDQLSRAPSRES